MATNTVVEDGFAGNTAPCPFTFKNHHIRTVIVDDQPWFVARDVCAALTIPWRGDTLRSIPSEWTSMRNLRMYEQNKRVKTISEPAVYKLAFRSNKPEADEFTNWVASEVLPAVRKTGGYQAVPEPSSAPSPPSPPPRTASRWSASAICWWSANSTPRRSNATTPRCAPT